MSEKTSGCILTLMVISISGDFFHFILHYIYYLFLPTIVQPQVKPQLTDISIYAVYRMSWISSWFENMQILLLFSLSYNSFVGCSHKGLRPQ
jgi:hypothetical protein